MKTLTFLLLLVLLSAIGCNRHSGKKFDLKQEILGHWMTEDPKYDYYFSPTHTITIGEGGRLEHDYKVLQVDEAALKITILDDGTDDAATRVFIFDPHGSPPGSKGSAKVEVYKGKKLTNTYLYEKVDDKQAP